MQLCMHLRNQSCAHASVYSCLFFVGVLINACARLRLHACMKACVGSCVNTFAPPIVHACVRLHYARVHVAAFDAVMHVSIRVLHIGSLMFACSCAFVQCNYLQINITVCTATLNKQTITMDMCLQNATYLFTLVNVLIPCLLASRTSPHSSAARVHLSPRHPPEAPPGRALPGRYLSLASMSAPAWSSRSTTAWWPVWAAKMRAVSPRPGPLLWGDKGGEEGGEKVRR